MVTAFLHSNCRYTDNYPSAMGVPAIMVVLPLFSIIGGGNTVTERNAGLGAAIGVLLSVCVVIVFTICNRVIKDDDLEF